MNILFIFHKDNVSSLGHDGKDHFLNKIVINTYIFCIYNDILKNKYSTSGNRLLDRHPLTINLKAYSYISR